MMKAVGQYHPLPVEHPEALLDIELPVPQAAGRDLLVRVHAVSVNPIDTKVRRRAKTDDGQARILGWDAAGDVVSTGPGCELFQVGDKVFYSGSVHRPGCNSEYHLVDERIVGRMPATLSYEEAAALPLTTVTAWESLFDRLRIAEDHNRNHGKSLLIIGGAGGVGSIAIQLARKVAGVKVIATAARPQTIKWVTALGAQHVVNHRQPLAPQLKGLNISPDYIFCCSDTSNYFEAMAELIKPQGAICVLVDANGPLDINLLKAKSVTLAWESMFTRAMYQTPDMAEQHRILNRIADLMDADVIRTTLTQTLSGINAANLRNVHAQIESGSTIGKIVLSGWG
jgi:NADPH2:quinone reductase